MFKPRRGEARAVVSTCVSAAGAAGAAGVDGVTKDNSGNLSIRDIAAKVLPSVVSIAVTATSGSGTGSGSIIQSDATKSYIITNIKIWIKSLKALKKP